MSISMVVVDDDDNVVAVVTDEENRSENRHENVRSYSNLLLNPMVHEYLVHYWLNQDHLMNSHHYVKDLYQSFF